MHNESLDIACNNLRYALKHLCGPKLAFDEKLEFNEINDATYPLYAVTKRAIDQARETISHLERAQNSMSSMDNRTRRLLSEKIAERQTFINRARDNMLANEARLFVHPEQLIETDTRIIPSEAAVTGYYTLCNYLQCFTPGHSLHFHAKALQRVQEVMDIIATQGRQSSSFYWRQLHIFKALEDLPKINPTTTDAAAIKALIEECSENLLPIFDQIGCYHSRSQEHHDVIDASVFAFDHKVRTWVNRMNSYGKASSTYQRYQPSFTGFARFVPEYPKTYQELHDAYHR